MASIAPAVFDLRTLERGPAGTGGTRVPERARRWIGGALLLFALSRLVSSGIVLAVIAVARPQSRIGPNAGFFDALTAWDGQWYQLIALSGYPSTLPVGPNGVAQNAWAFLPAYPYLVRFVAGGSNAAWPVAAVCVSVVFAALASVLLAALLRPHVGTRGALVAVALFCFSPVAFVLQAAYAESMGLCLTFAVLLLIDWRRPLLAVPLVVLLAFTRPGLQAVALLVGVHLVLRVVRARRGGEALAAREVAALLLLLAVSTAGGWAWSWTAAAVTGQADAYVATELAWRWVWTGQQTLVPVTPWFDAGEFWFGGFSPLVLALLLGGATAVVLSRTVRRIGSTGVVWLAAWGVYLLAVFLPQSSTFRVLMPIAPIGGALGGLRTRTIVALVLLSVGAQGVWAFCVYGYWPRFWAVL